MRSIHSDVLKPTVCEICLKEINSNMQKHRKICIKCRNCDYENTKKARLLNHILKCQKGLSLQSTQEEPMDLRSPLKKKEEEFDVGAKRKQTESSSIEPTKQLLDKKSTIDDNPTCTTKKKTEPYNFHRSKVVEDKELLDKGNL